MHAMMHAIVEGLSADIGIYPQKQMNFIKDIKAFFFVLFFLNVNFH